MCDELYFQRKLDRYLAGEAEDSEVEGDGSEGGGKGEGRVGCGQWGVYDTTGKRHDRVHARMRPTSGLLVLVLAS